MKLLSVVIVLLLLASPVLAEEEEAKPFSLIIIEKLQQSESPFAKGMLQIASFISKYENVVVTDNEINNIVNNVGFGVIEGVEPAEEGVG
tara:strand:+ start:2002 stop:2271 length:270 start_codon:yes stop_codon:yes gene_type:complete